MYSCKKLNIVGLTKQFLPQTRANHSNVFDKKSTLTEEEKKEILQPSFSKFYYDLCGYNKYGLYKDDLLIELNKDVKEAVRRLPEHIRLQRSYRTIKAFQAEINNSLLPKEEWTKFEDKNHSYLQPYLREVIAERKEREEWEANH